MLKPTLCRLSGSGTAMSDRVNRGRRARITISPTHRFRLLGLDQGKRYRIRLQDHRSSRLVSGRALLHGGIDVALPLPLSFELILLEEIS
jgi:hypothetical protein